MDNLKREKKSMTIFNTKKKSEKNLLLTLMISARKYHTTFYVSRFVIQVALMSATV